MTDTVSQTTRDAARLLVTDLKPGLAKVQKLHDERSNLRSKPKNLHFNYRR